MSSFHVDVNTTKSCTLRCTYCIESKDEMNKNFKFSETDALIRFIDSLLASDFMNSYNDLCINFWGGEPTLNPELFEMLTSIYETNKKVRFFIFTNGFHISDYYINAFKHLQQSELEVNGHKKIVIQVSYDGQPLHDATRITPKGKGSSEKVTETIRQLQSEKIFHVLKSTIDPTGFKHLYEAYLDVLKYTNNYFPTIELHQEFEGEDYKQYGRDLWENLCKIAAHERRTGERRFFWFKENKALCAAGKDMIAIDIDGNILPCHGALYTDYDEHLITNIKEIQAVDCVIQSSKRFERFWNMQPKKCKDCQNAFCLRCNIAKYHFSKNDTYEEKWSDHTSQPYYCYYMDIVNVVIQAAKKV